MATKEQVRNKVIGGCRSHKEVKATWSNLYEQYTQLTGHTPLKSGKYSKLDQVTDAGNLNILWAILNEETVQIKPMPKKELENPNLDPAIHIMVAGRRFHKIDEETAYPGVTTVLKETGDPYLQKIFADYYSNNVKKYGKKRADKIKALPTKRGTFLHDTIEHYLLMPPENRKAHAIHGTLAKHLVPFLDRITKVHGIEERLVNHDFCFAGSADLIAQLDDGKNYVIDWKTSKKNLYPSNTKDYQIQGSCYAETFEANTGIQIDGVIIMALFTVPQLKKKIRVKMLKFERDHCQAMFDEFLPRLWKFNEILDNELVF